MTSAKPPERVTVQVSRAAILAMREMMHRWKWIAAGPVLGVPYGRTRKEIYGELMFLRDQMCRGNIVSEVMAATSDLRLNSRCRLPRFPDRIGIKPEEIVRLMLAAERKQKRGRPRAQVRPRRKP